MVNKSPKSDEINSNEQSPSDLRKIFTKTNLVPKKFVPKSNLAKYTGTSNDQKMNELQGDQGINDDLELMESPLKNETNLSMLDLLDHLDQHEKAPNTNFSMSRDLEK